MAVGVSEFPIMPEIAALRLGTARAGIKTPERRDLVVVEVPEGASLAGVFTLNAFCAAPVTIAKQHLAEQGSTTGGTRYLVVNTGNANAGTGQQGIEDARLTCEELARLAGVETSSVLPFSTGVIGEPLPMSRLLAGLPAAYASLSQSAQAWLAAGEGILTTDTRAKGATRTLNVGGSTVTINGIAKGSGMIKPNMATMLGFVATDASISPEVLESLLRDSVATSFNSITVDGDTSTNDACMLISTNQGVRIESEDALAHFGAALEEVMIELAQEIVRDGEGASKFVTLEVEQAACRQEALDVAFTVAHSPLVKTALAASDANWGRILAAVGRAPVDNFDVAAITIDIGDVRIVEHGGRAESYTEAAGSAVMAEENITIRIVLGRGADSARVWTTDLTQQYVAINADYRS
ncbi:bifunctional glutamate N-acetyltransferase/amino-acid acetyltransferase ArgJ [Halomonas halocynthiae]|uniref:bifunctional glutamate N-acetyltransferase/amino-acid acetyltransferase ArgJ n=1 Tax=Halomonas halocynthiae TaxID=176290 RepID=UPI00042797E1|nr:bifunctional glutamate N-acetyltransferase/amino-acid acetyltransferase ArgJ [Halomonas halocynthiae]